MKKIILIIILSQFSFLLWAANNDNGESKYIAKFYIEYDNVDNYLLNIPCQIEHHLDFEHSLDNKSIGFSFFHNSFGQNSYYTYEFPPKEEKYNLNFYSNISSQNNTNSITIDEYEYKKYVNYTYTKPCKHKLGESTITLKIKNSFNGSNTYRTIKISYFLEIRPYKINCTYINPTFSNNIILYDEPICINATAGFPKELYQWLFSYKNSKGRTIKGTFTPFKTEDNGATIYVKGSDFLSESTFYDLVYNDEPITISPNGGTDVNIPLNFNSINLTATPSAPNITKVTFDKPKCSNTPATNVTVHLSRPIAQGENIILQLIDFSDNQKKNEINASICGSDKISIGSIEAKKWEVIHFKTTYKNITGEDVSSNSEGDGMHAYIEITAPDPLSLKTKNSVNTRCSGDSNGTISYHITGGTGNKTYTLSSNNTQIESITQDSSEVCTFKDLKAGTYYISTTDANGCESENKEEITIGEPTPVTLSASVDSNPKCQGSYDGGLSYNTSGGTGNIKCYLQNLLHEVIDSTYSNSFSRLSAGTYYLSAKDTNGCLSDTISTFISEPEALFLSLETKNNTKKGGKSGELFATFGGGTEPYILDYAFGKTDSISAKIDTLLSKTLPAVDTLVVLSDKNGCITSKEFSITEPDSLKAVVRQVDFIKCYGDSTASLEIESITGGTPPYYIKWSHFDLDLENKYKIDNLPASSYMLKVKTGYQDSIFISVDIDEPSKIKLLPSVTNTACVGEASGSILLNANGGTAPYKFSLNEQYSSSGEYNQLEAGYYNISVEDENGCKTEDSVEVKTLSDINLNVTSSSPTCYGIDNGSIFITIDNGESPYSVHIADKDYSEVKGNLNLEDLKAGYYNIEVKDSLGCIKTADAILTEPTEFNIELPEKIYLCNDQSEVVNIENERITNVDWYLNNDLVHTGLNNTLTQEGVYKLDFLYDNLCHSFGEIEVDTINKKVDANFLVAAEIPINDDAHLLNITKAENYDYQEWIYPTNDAWIYGEDENSLQLVFLKEGSWNVGLISYLDKCTASQFKTVKTFIPDSNFEQEENTYLISELSIDKSPNNGKFTAKIELSDKTDIKLYLYNASNGHIIDFKEATGEKSYEVSFSVSTTTGEYILLAVAPTWQKSKWIKMIIK